MKAGEKMEKEEIIAGIKQAIERGYSLEQAKRSFINAGYSFVDAEDSAGALTGIAGKISSQEEIPLEQKQEIFQQPTPKFPKQLVSQQNNSKLKIFIVILAMLLLLLIAGLFATIFYKEKIIGVVHKFLA